MSAVRYRYRAATAEGRLVEGTLQSHTRDAVLEEIRRQRLFPIELVEVAVGPKPAFQKRLTRAAAVTLWTRTAGTLLAAGMPLDRMLAFTAAHAGHEDFGAVLQQVRRSVQGGATLADALALYPRYFPPMVIAMISAGESSGALDTIFVRLSEHLEESAELRSQVRSALLYPALMSVVAGLGVSVLMFFVVPRFTAILEDVGGSLPWTTRALVAFSSALIGGWWIWLLAVLAIGLSVRTALQDVRVRERLHAARLGWPLAGDLELKYSTARFARTLGLLLKSGVPILAAMRIAKAAVPNSSTVQRIERAAGAVARGEGVAAALNGSLPPLALEMIAVGEESGQLDELCVRVADTYDTEVRRALRTLVAMIEPAMILLFGALVGFVALAMLQAIYSINVRTF